MRLMHDQRGFTLIEVTTVTGLMVMVIVCIVSMTIASLKTYDSASNRTYTDMDAVMAMQKMVYEVREAKEIKILGPGPDGGNRLRVILPVQAEGHDYYDRHKADNGHFIDFYLSDSSGAIGHSGNCLWRSQPAGHPHSGRSLLGEGVESIDFEQDTDRSVQITVICQNDAPTGAKRTELTQRVVYLRNY